MNEYPFAILDADGNVVDRAGNVSTVISVLYGDLSYHPGTARTVQVPFGTSMDEAAERIAYHADINADCWDIPLDKVERVNA